MAAKKTSKKITNPGLDQALQDIESLETTVKTDYRLLAVRTLELLDDLAAKVPGIVAYEFHRKRSGARDATWFTDLRNDLREALS